MKEATSFISGLITMFIDIALWNMWAFSEEGILKYIFLILASVMLGLFWNRRLI